MMKHRPDKRTDQLDLRLVGPAITVWAGTWLTTGWDWGKWAAAGLAAVIAVVAAVMWLRGRHLAQAGADCESTTTRVAQVTMAAWAICVVAVSSAVIGGARVLSLEHGVVAQAGMEGRVAQVEIVLQQVKLTPTWGSVVAQATTEQVALAGHNYRVRQPVTVMVSAAAAQAWLKYPAGSVLGMTARLSSVDIADGVAAQLSVLDEARLVRPPPWWQSTIESMRQGLSLAMVHSPPEQAGLIPALVVGDTSAMSATVVDDFTTTGLTHLTAVSGANLAVLLAFLSTLARRAGVRGTGLTLVSAVGVIAFVLMCHSEPSVLRAAAMGLVSLVAVGRGSGKRSGVRGLCLAVMGLCWVDPWMSRSWGMALSVLACTGIIVWGGRWATVLSRWLPRWVAEAMAIPLSAQLLTQPVVTYLSGAVSVSGLIANAAAEPWVAPATVVGLVAAVASVFNLVVASWLGYVAGWCAQPILTVSHVLAHLPGASHAWPTTAVGLVVISVGCGVLAWVMPLLLDRVWVVLAVSVALVVTMLSAPYQPGWPGQDWRVTACDVGQGDATVVRVDQTSAILLDTGPSDAGVVGCLDRLQITEIPLVILTHFHADHTGGLPQVIERFPVAGLLVPEGGGDPDTVLSLAQASGIGVTRAHAGARATVGDATVTVLSAYQSGLASSDGEESSTENDESLVVRVDTPQMSLLATGDVEPLGQQAALSNPAALKVDILKVPHHGSSRQDPDFLQASGASIALISVGKDNGYGHPTSKALSWLNDAGMEVLRTDEHGSIVIARTRQWSITTER
ncbi:MAG: ComEC/Rec2 family competence protein [Propionibacteriaceae bacterium]|nr:ComEC/Rec2 family competence protein [Propionibacteriaceae bacterium]